MQFADGSHLDVDMLVISAGIRPRDELAKSSGLETHPRGGILVDNFLQTSDPAIFAIGECAVAHHMIYGLVAPGYEMADVVASRLMGDEKEFKPYDMSTKLKLIGTDVGSFGDPFAVGLLKQLSTRTRQRAFTSESTYRLMVKSCWAAFWSAMPSSTICCCKPARTKPSYPPTPKT